MALPWVKVIFAVVVLTVGLLGAFLPWSLRTLSPSDRTLALGDTFAGGVLGGAGLIHLLNRGLHGFRVVAPLLGYPVALLLAGIGFMLILLIEGVIVADRPAADVPHGARRSPGIQHEIGANLPPQEPRRPYVFYSADRPLSPFDHPGSRTWGSAHAVGDVRRIAGDSCPQGRGRVRAWRQLRPIGLQPTPGRPPR
jgi:hypothetical protein